jgi:hypothetical protein
MPQELLYDVLWHVAVDHARPDRVPKTMRMKAEEPAAGVEHTVSMREFINCVQVEVRRRPGLPYGSQKATVLLLPNDRSPLAVAAG